jgi:hypothetical protein
MIIKIVLIIVLKPGLGIITLIKKSKAKDKSYLLVSFKRIRIISIAKINLLSTSTIFSVFLMNS